MKAKVNIDTRKCVGRFGPKYSKAQQFLDNEVLRDCTPYVPVRTGNLFMSGITGTKLGSGKIVYNASYARKVYYGLGMNFSKKKHPQACAQWFEKVKPLKKAQWIASARKIMKEG